MSSPIAALLLIDKAVRQPVYLQIANQLMMLIRQGALPAGQRLPSSREIAGLLHVHRKTVVQAYEELLVQGWLESHVGSGTFVARHLPEIRPRGLLNGPGGANGLVQVNALRADALVANALRADTMRLDPMQINPVPANPVQVAGFIFQSRSHLDREVIKPRIGHHLDDGFPDPRLAPLKELSRSYRSQLLTGNSYVRLGYGDPAGSSRLRQELSSYLNETRGLKTGPENILITRGTTMGVYLVSAAFLQSGDNVVVGESNWSGANMNFLQAGANLVIIPTDQYGIDVDSLEQYCRKQRVRLVYVTSHHHYPTTVALRADRRIQLLRLAAAYGFIIFEDDYDYDFHYLSKPLLPLASADQVGMVLYCGSFTKTVSPAFRIGYLVGPENVIRHLAQLRRIIDRQGDSMLENAMAELLQNGIIQRYLRKALRMYRQRRDVFCDLLKDRLGDYVEFQVPDGGMAVWTRFDPGTNLPDLAKRAMEQGLYIPDGLRYNPDSKLLNSTRLGFASSSPAELEHCVEIMAGLVRMKKGGKI
jgi:GntR family transcriptional regulator / MocR family aminotransferase